MILAGIDVSSWLYLTYPKEVEVAQTVDVVLQVLLDVDMGVAVVLGESKTHSAARPGEQNTFGKLWSEDDFHTTSKPDAIQGEVVVVEV